MGEGKGNGETVGRLLHDRMLAPDYSYAVAEDRDRVRLLFSVSVDVLAIGVVVASRGGKPSRASAVYACLASVQERQIVLFFGCRLQNKPTRYEVLRSSTKKGFCRLSISCRTSTPQQAAVHNTSSRRRRTHRATINESCDTKQSARVNHPPLPLASPLFIAKKQTKKRSTFFLSRFEKHSRGVFRLTR